MADVQPFCAVRYAHPSPALVAPPYDVLSPGERDRLRASDPHNVVHVTAADDEAEAGALYRRWLADGVLVRDDEPAVWVWEQELTSGGGDTRSRRGVVASLRAEPYDRRIVLPHERTHAGPIRGRLRLLRAAQAQVEPLFFLYEGRPPLDVPDRPPDLEAGDTRLWRLGDGGRVTEFFDGRQVLIADGHHRYETSVAYAAENGVPGADRVLAVLVATDDPGLEILATHRMFAGRPELAWDGEQCDGVDDALARLDGAAGDRSAAIFYRAGGPVLARGDHGQLDVELVDGAGLDGISYTVDAHEAVARVDGGEADCAFLVRPTPIEAVFERARQGGVMPPKTTYFSPKLTSGLLFLPLGEE